MKNAGVFRVNPLNCWELPPILRGHGQLDQRFRACKRGNLREQPVNSCLFAVLVMFSSPMAHNRSPSKIRSDVLMSPLGSFRGWLLEMECGVSACPTGRTRKVDALVAAWPDLTVLAAVLAEPRGPCRRVPLRGPECRQ